MTVPDVVVELTAAAETLHKRAMRCEKHADCMFVGDRKADALATLIDGMLGKRGEATNYLGVLDAAGESFSKHLAETATGAALAAIDECLDLLATYTRTVLGSTT